MTSMLEDYLPDDQNNRKRHNVNLCHLHIGTAYKRMSLVATCFQTLVLQCFMLMPSQTPHEPTQI